MAGVYNPLMAVVVKRALVFPDGSKIRRSFSSFYGGAGVCCRLMLSVSAVRLYQTLFERRTSRSYFAGRV